MKLIATLSLIALLSTPAIAQTQPNINDYQLFLVPVFSFGPGAHNSEWESSVNVASVEETATMPVPFLADHIGDCTSPDGVISDREVRFVCPGLASPSGLFLYVPRTLEENQFFATSRVRDLTRQASSAGTAIPVVHETEFRVDSILLLDIPTDERFRSNLRIYAGPVAGAGDPFISSSEQNVTIEFFDSRAIDVSPPLARIDLDLSPPEKVAGNPYFVRPGYASIADLLAMFPQLSNVPSYTIRITTLHPITSPPITLSTWAFVTITNNDTQEVTTVVP